MPSTVRTVFIVDDDPDFLEVVRHIFDSDSSWKVTRTFTSLESLLESFPIDVDRTREVLPDLMVVDLFASRLPPTEIAPVTGYQAVLILRDTGLQFGTLIISSMSSPTLLATLRSQHPEGWSYLVKSAKLTSEEILRVAEEALI
jgi:DNA-binding NarL/FixJ family response regulator